MKTYTELQKLKTFLDRFEYLKLNGEVGKDTFGYDRYLNQALYNSKEWKDIRNKVIIRDEGKDLGFDGHCIYGKCLIHHINPISKEDIVNRDPKVFDMDNLITVSMDTHNAIHYGNYEQINKEPISRTPGDTKLWK